MPFGRDEEVVSETAAAASHPPPLFLMASAPIHFALTKIAYSGIVPKKLSLTWKIAALNQNTFDERMSQASFSQRRRLEHMQGRRSVSTRFSISERHSELSRSHENPVIVQSGARRQVTMNHTGTLEEAETRRLQFIRGAIQRRYVVSKAALQSLQAVEMKELSEGDRSKPYFDRFPVSLLISVACMICYNEYETASPEGICENPIRLPKCKHVFGNHCIRKWFQDSDSCPYCRDKLQSVPKHYPSSTRAFMDMMRIRGWVAGSEVAEDFYQRIMNSEDVRDLVHANRAGVMVERRPAPNGEHDDSSRRTRQRRSSTSSVEQQSPSLDQQTATITQATSRRRTAPNPSGQVSPTQAGVSGNPWILMGPGSPGGMSQDTPFRYQSPARPSPSTTTRPRGPAMRPSTAHHGYARQAGLASGSGLIPNPLRSGTQEASDDISINQMIDDLYSSDAYSSGGESADSGL